MKIRKWLRWTWRVISRTALIGLALIPLLLLSFWLEIRSGITLPAPTGEHAVGRTTYFWTDTSRIDMLSPEPHIKRELVVWIWYPADPTGSDSVVEYDRAPWEKGDVQPASALFRLFFARDGRKIQAHAFQDAPLSNARERYPVLLMKSGIGTLATDYTAFAEELASHGYVVVGSDAPYSTFEVVLPDGRVIHKTPEGNPGEAESGSAQRDTVLEHLVGIWTADTRFVLDELARIDSTARTDRFFHRMDMHAVGVFGHSFGGATAAQFCHDEPRCKAGVNLDGAPYGSVVREGLDRPFMFLLADHSTETDPTSMRIKARVRAINETVAGERRCFYLKGARHFNFCDMAYQKEFLVMRLFGGTGPIGRRPATATINACLRAFFDLHLKGKRGLDEMIKGRPDLVPAAL